VVGVVQCKNKYKEEDEEEFYAIFFFPSNLLRFVFAHLNMKDV
jgi:hypothetical protein